jgi:rSAM/selenodomain-associated transferase 2
MKTLSSPKGRGIQCNSGARAASNEFLLFLHADSRLPENANKTLTDFFSNPSNLIGAFTIQFKPSHIILDLITVASRIDTPITSFGDQCIFMRRELYDEIGGFPDWPLFEDMKMFQEARKLTKVHKIKEPVITSSRRFYRKGVLKQFALNTWLILQYYLGVHPEELVKSYV